MRGFILSHGLWSEDQHRRAEEVREQVEKEGLELIRLAWADPHGYSRTKLVSARTFMSVLDEGYTISGATSTLDSASARVFSSFVRGGGMDLPEMTGSPNLVIVPDPDTFRTLPWAPGVGWVICNEYFSSGAPFHFSSRHLLLSQLKRLAERGQDLMVGLEIEWCLFGLSETRLGPDNIGRAGVRGKPIKTHPIEPGYHYHSESNMDLMQPVLSELAKTYEHLGFGLRSIENELGPGQVECTFDATHALKAADDAVLLRTATRQVCRRLGYFATFMCWPAIAGCFPNGWHLHQSLIDAASGNNLFAADTPDKMISPLAANYLGGLLDYALPATVFSTPTVNGYRRFRPNSLAPDRIGWAYDHRGAMIRIMGRGGDRSTHFENRLGESAANPYFFLASQIAAGLAGIDGACDPGPECDEPYATARPKLPTGLGDALDALEDEPVFRKAFGNLFITYYLKLKRNELRRYEAFVETEGAKKATDTPSEWEQNEYFDFF